MFHVKSFRELQIKFKKAKANEAWRQPVTVVTQA